MKNKKIVKYFPFVSIICVTYNRRPFFEVFFQCIRDQDYPANRFEVIIVDDGSDKIRDLVEKSKIPQIKYFEVREKMTLGRKRNYSHTLVDKRSKYITYFDDDDYHHPNRVSHAVDMLERNPSAMCAGASELYVYFKNIQKMYQFGPYAPNHATAGTFTFNRTLINTSFYDNDACLGEEKSFLKDYTVPFIQLDPMKTILVVSHAHNTFDKRNLLENANSRFVKESIKDIDMFIPQKHIKIKNFFLHEIDKLLMKYDIGEIKHKPDVSKQLLEIKAQHEKLKNEEIMSKIMVDKPGQGQVILTNDEVVDMIKNLQIDINVLLNENNTLKEQNKSKLMIEKPGQDNVLLTNDEVVDMIKNLQNEIGVLLDENNLLRDEKMSSIMMDKPGQGNVFLTNNEVVDVIKKLQKEISEFSAACPPG